MELFKMPGVTCREFEKGDIIIGQAEQLRYVYYLTKGTCYRITITEKGDEIIHSIREPTHSIYSFLGVLALFADGVSIAQFQAKSRCRCYKIPRDTFLKYISDKPEILIELLKMALTEYRNMHNCFKARQGGKTANRLCDILLRNSSEIKCRMMVDKNLSKISNLSSLLGVHDVTVAKIIKSLKTEKVIEKRKEGILILDKEKLAAFAKDESALYY
jgi:CRP-like cAMP-binding protein